MYTPHIRLLVPYTHRPFPYVSAPSSAFLSLSVFPSHPRPVVSYPFVSACLSEDCIFYSHFFVYISSFFFLIHSSSSPISTLIVVRRRRRHRRFSARSFYYYRWLSSIHKFLLVPISPNFYYYYLSTLVKALPSFPSCFVLFFFLSFCLCVRFFVFVFFLSFIIPFRFLHARSLSSLIGLIALVRYCRGIFTYSLVSVGRVNIHRKSVKGDSTRGSSMWVVWGKLASPVYSLGAAMMFH